MKTDYQNGAIVGLLIVVLYLQPHALVHLATFALGRAALLFGVIVLTYRSVPIGLLAALLALSLLEGARQATDLREGLDAGPGDRKKALFRKQHCREGALVPPEGGGGAVSPEDVNKVYPQVKFKNPVSPCDPCTTGCRFDLLDVDETLTRGDREAGESEKGTTLTVQPSLAPRLKAAGGNNKGDLPTLPEL